MKSTFYPVVCSVKQQGSAEFYSADILAIVEVAKALGGSLKLVTPAPKPEREMTQLPRETQKDGDTNKLKQYKHTKIQT